MLRRIFSALTGLGNIFSFFNRQSDKRAGSNREKLRQSEQGREASKEMREIENEVTGLPADARRERNRKWVRRGFED